MKNGCREVNIIFLLDTLAQGGSEKSAIILINLINKYSIINLSVVILDSGEKNPRFIKNQYRIPDEVKVDYIYKKNYRSIEKLILTPITLYKLKRKIKNNVVDTIVSFHDYSNLLNVLLKKTFNHKVITSERRYSKHYFGIRNIYMKFFIKYVFNSSDIIISNDIEIRESLINDYKISSKISVLNNLFINIKSDNKTSTNGNDKFITFITAGRLSNEKNTKDILYALSKMTNKQVRLIILGSGPNEKKLKNLASSLNIQKQVQFLGGVGNVHDYFTNADIFVFSSLNEGFPNVILEAMYAELPIISYHFKAGIKSILDNGKYGVLIEKSNIDKLSYAMDELSVNKNLQEKYSNLSKKRIKNYCDEKKYFNDFINIIN